MPIKSVYQCQTAYVVAMPINYVLYIGQVNLGRHCYSQTPVLVEMPHKHISCAFVATAIFIQLLANPSYY